MARVKIIHEMGCPIHPSFQHPRSVMSGVRQHPTLHTLGSEGIGEILWNSAPDGDGDYFYNNDQSVQQQKS